MAILTLQNVGKKFGNKRVLEKFNLKLEEGEIVSLLGPSGCGKTTLLRIAAGLERADEGKVFLGNKPVAEALAKEPRIIAIFQDYPPYRREKSGKRSPYWFMYQRWYFQIIKERISLVSNLMKIEKKILLGLRPVTQSRGEEQRLDLSRYLLTIKKVALLDNPLLNLDRIWRERIEEKLKIALKKFGLTAIYATSEEEEAHSFAKKVFLMEEGRITDV